jgi:Glycosyltransferase family 92
MFPAKLSLLAIFKNETLNLRVWIEHYLWQGVEKFYLIDNGSTDDPLSILQPHIESGKVVYIYLPEKHKQREHYVKVIEEENLKDNTEWLIICDLDEFFYGCPDTLYNLLDNYKDYDIIYSNWRLFGSDGCIDHPEDIRKSNLHRDSNLSSLTKFILRPNRIVSWDIQLTIHEVLGLGNYIIENDKIHLNHYVTQSLEYFTKVKMTRGDVERSEHDSIRDMEYFRKHEDNKNVKDTTLFDMTIGL